MYHVFTTMDSANERDYLGMIQGMASGRSNGFGHILGDGRTDGGNHHANHHGNHRFSPNIRSGTGIACDSSNLRDIGGADAYKALSIGTADRNQQLATGTIGSVDENAKLVGEQLDQMAARTPKGHCRNRAWECSV